MSAESPSHREREIFQHAADVTGEAERRAYVLAACGDDGALLARVLALLQKHDGASAVLPAAPAARSGTELVPGSEQPGQRIGRYKLLQKIGEGGMGVVWMAEQEEPVRRRVALKIIKAGMDTKAVIARFEAERQALALMDHPNIAKVFDGGVTGVVVAGVSPAVEPGVPPGGPGVAPASVLEVSRPHPGGRMPPSTAGGTPAATGRPYFVMELVRGIKITDYCDQAGLSTAERLQLFIQVCQAVQHAHQKGIIHRDLKPSNILVTVNDGVALPKVIDFGIAKATDQRLTDKTYFTQFQAFIGTPAYTSPEQAEMSSLDIDTRSDIYSLGVLLYELLTGQTPFPAERLLQSGLDEMRRIIREEEPPRPSTRLTTLGLAAATELSRKRQAKIPQLASAVQGDLDWIVMKALEKDRTRRYATSLDFAADLQRHLNSEAVLARPPSLAYKLQRAVRRNKGPFAAAAAIFLALLAGLSLTAWQAVRAKNAEQAARNAERAERAQAEQARADRDRARLAESNATVHATEATNALQTANERMVKLNVAEGWRRVEEGDHFGALLPFAEAFALEQDKPDRADIHQMRLASVLQRSPKLVNVWSVGSVIHQAEFSKDGKRLLVVGVDGRDSRARIWDCATGQLLTEPMPHESAITHVHWSDDETKVATASWDKTARVWDAKTGQPLTPPLPMSGSVIWTDFDFSGTRLATLSWKDPGDNDEDLHPNGQLAVWEVSTGRALWITNAPVLDIQDFVMFSPQGSEVITTAEIRWAEDGTAVRQLKHHSWKLDSGNTVTWDEDWSVNSHRTAFSPDGSRLFIAPSPCRYYYSRSTQKAQAVLLDGQQLSREVGKLNASGRPRLGQFSPDGRQMATANEGFMARVWDSATGAPVSPPLRHLGRVDALAFSADGRKLATATDCGMARIWDAESGEPLSPPLPHRSALLRLAFLAGDTQLMTVGRDGTVSLWDFRAADVPRFTWRKCSYDVALSVDSKNPVLNLDTYEPKLFSLRDGSPILPPLKLPEFSVEGWDGSYDSGFSSDGTFTFGAVGYRSNQFIWPNWNTTTGECRTNSVAVHSTARSTNVVEWSPDRRFVLIGGPGLSSGEKAHYRVWDTSTGRAVMDGMMHRVRFSPDGNWILGVKTNGMIAMWSAQDGELKTEFGEKDSVRRDLVTDARATRMVTAGTNGLDVWDTQTRQRLGQVRGETVFSADGEYLATWEERRVNLYRVTKRVELLRTLEHPMNSKWPVRENMVFSSDSKVLMTRDELGMMRLWSVPDGDLIRQQAIGPEGRVHVSPGGQGLIDTALENEVRYWSLKSLQRSASDWKAVAAFFSPDKPLDRSSDNGPGAANLGIEAGPSRAKQSRVAAWSSMRRIFPEAFQITAQELEGWHRHLAARFEAAQDWTNAIHHLSRLLEAHPNHGEFLPRRAEAHVSWARWLATNAHPQPTLVTNFLERALDDYNRTLAWVDGFPAAAAESRRVYLRSRSEVFRKLGRLDDSRRDLGELNRIIPRAPGTSPDLVDLSAHYNESLPAWFVPGARELATGVKYDLRAGIELGTGWDEYPSQVLGIQVGRPGRRLHFLHWVTHCNACPDNEVGQKTGDFARLTIHLENGDHHVVQLRLVEDVWYHGDLEGEAAARHHSRVALDEPRYGDCPRHQGTRWFQRTWENPKPEVAIERVDFESISESVWVRLWAITVEP